MTQRNPYRTATENTIVTASNATFTDLLTRESSKRIGACSDDGQLAGLR